MITTKIVKLNSKELFNLLIHRYVQKRWWVLIWLSILAFFFIQLTDKDKWDYFFITLIAIAPILTIIQFWIFTHRKSNKLFLLDRYYEIDKDKINGIIDQDSHSSIKLEHIRKVVLYPKQIEFRKKLKKI